MRNIKTILCVFILGLYSCSKTTPSGFWESFEPQFLKENISNQGPFGGRRAMYWKAAQVTIKSQDILNYTHKEGWEVIDSLEVQTEDMSKWIYNGNPIFPLSHDGFSVKRINNAMHKHFPRWITAKAKVYLFTTDWAVFDLGTDESNYENGFVLLSDDGSEMSVYHIWGE